MKPLENHLVRKISPSSSIFLRLYLKQVKVHGVIKNVDFVLAGSVMSSEERSTVAKVVICCCCCHHKSIIAGKKKQQCDVVFGSIILTLDPRWFGREKESLKKKMEKL